MQLKFLTLGAVAVMMAALTSAHPSPQFRDATTQVVGDAIDNAATQGNYNTLPTGGGRNVGRPGGRSNYGKRSEEEENENENESEFDFDLLGLGGEA